MDRLDVMSDMSEVVHYDEPGLPLYIREGVLSRYPDYRAECHWHDDLELIHVLEGRMEYSVNGRLLSLERGDCLFVNARQLHFGFGRDREECLFTCVLVRPELLTASPRLYETYLAPLVGNPALPWLCLRAGDRLHADFDAGLTELWRLKKERPEGYQLRAVNLLSDLTLSLRSRLPEGAAEPEDRQLPVQKRMVAFIARSYAEELTLEDIARSGAVSKSTCCRLFRAYVHQTPIEFLNDYRLRVAERLLTETDRSATEIALLCGFSGASYFTKLFRERCGVSPGKYRKQRAVQK